MTLNPNKHYNNARSEAGMHVKLIIALTLIALLSIFVIQNSEVVALQFLFWKIEMSRALMFVFLLLTGTGIGWILRGRVMHKAARLEEKNGHS